MRPRRETYLNPDTLPLPFCPGCGHHTIIQSLDQALVQLGLDPKDVVVVTDIGCAGLSDKYFDTHAFHGLHGRSVTYATGIKMAQPELTVIVLIGDGGFGIGGHHMLNAARRNIGVNVFVFNNLNYGMTGGEHSVTTPPDARTSTTPYGHLEQPLDIPSSVGLNGANFTARVTTFDPDLPELMAQAIQHEGFSLVDIWELCTAYYVPHNQFSKSKLEETLARLNFETGVLHEHHRPEFSQRYRETALSDRPREEVMGLTAIQPTFRSELKAQKSVIIAGAAGAKIGTAGTLFSQGAILSGLQATQRNDYPVTVKTGHSIAEVVLGPEDIFYTGVDTPDVLLALFPEGFNKVKKSLSTLAEENLLILSEELPAVDTPAQMLRLDFRSAKRWRRRQEYRAIIALGVLLRKTGLYPLDAFKEAIKLKPRFAEDNLAALEASEDIGVV
jgi:pyruvate/2-oxoacid:ferredoxin oxidoreductase beta subunit/Pyruvate/2-oxoacid:ferredoxin oxidoreductase gamma subunit